MQRILLILIIVLLSLVSMASATVTPTRVTVADSATVLVAAVSFRQDVAISNRGTGAAMFIGDSTVTTSDGFQLDQDQTISFGDLANTAIYGIVASGTETAHVIRAF